MIIQKVRGKNFLSIGNAFLEFDIQKYSRTVISGKNGSAKSSISSLITFALFGQTIKNINRAQIINSINGKHCLVEVEFSANNNQYLVRRGIKPNIFEIFENSIQLEQTLSSDFQEYLEKNILKTNFKTFLQTSVLSVENYKPFMTLRSHERRAFIEEILDIKVFTFMNQILKSKYSKNREELKLLDVKLKAAFSKAKMQKQHIEQIESIQSNNRDQLKSKIDSLKLEKNCLVAEVAECNKSLTRFKQDLAKLNSLSKEHQDILTKLDKIEKFISSGLDKLNSVKDEDVCPVCNSEIHESYKHNIIEPIQRDIDSFQEKKHLLLTKLEAYSDVSNQLDATTKMLSDLTTKLSTNNALITKLNNELDTLTEEADAISKMEDLSDMKVELKQTAVEALQFKQQQADINTEQTYNEMMLELFKDSGIKSKIVDQYIPIINNLINVYLEKLDFFVSFNLDSEFNEIIKSRHRDEFTYGSFSAGERTKIDIALLFTFRQLSKIRNSFDCNMLFIDEILEFLDENGSAYFLSMIDELDEFRNSNIFIISHKLKDQLAEVFDGHLHMHKELGFSLVEDRSK